MQKWHLDTKTSDISKSKR